VFITGATGTPGEIWIQAAHRPALGYPHAGQIVTRRPSTSTLVTIAVPYWSPLRFLSLLPEFVPAAKAVHTQLTDQDTSLPAARHHSPGGGPTQVGAWEAEQRAIVARADQQHAWTLAGDPRGTYGD
jgi:hypothetical protein